MKKTKRLWALLLAMVMALGLITTAFAAPTIDSGRKASLSLYKYDITAASADGAWDAASYVSTGVQDDAVTDKLAKYAIQGVEFSYLRVASISTYSQRESGQYKVGVLYGFADDAVLQAIEQAARIFGGHYRALTREMEQEMAQAAEELDFERAAALRDRVRAVSVLGKTQGVIAGVCADTDVWGLYRGQVRWGFGVLHLEEGNLLGREVKVLAAGAEEDEGETLSAVLRQYYAGRGAAPKEICVAALPEDAEALEELLSRDCGHRVNLRVPQRGQRAELLRMAQSNAREETERITSEAERVNKTLEQLGALAGLSAGPHRIEAYDISNTGSADMVASMVVFQDGKPLKRDYRKFQVKTLDHPDDYAAMREILGRRLQRYLDGDEKFTPLPELILMDGGQQHAAVAEEVLAEKGLTVAVLGMVKDDKHRTRALMTAGGQELGIQHSPPLFALVGQVQEEVHRFAITYHRKKHSRSAVRSRLDGISGLGEVRKKALLKHFGSVKTVTQAEQAELEAVLPKAVAEAVYKNFHSET